MQYTYQITQIVMVHCPQNYFQPSEKFHIVTLESCFSTRLKNKLLRFDIS